ncbi:hypothetical protein [Sporosarcina highlanderae]|uniref:Uncharacterized protein n=1 Tax=Sporosarcina highlanderae TaxID=3035916 RepID=A0ABT8JWS8_9BACL|nr:hypothetical protein [Sporosarcina highlanderae]MDN4609016.1 hypothetical protein [Sporosarcina highlanderae]
MTENTNIAHRGPIFDLLASLTPGESIEEVFINGKKESVETFASFNRFTGLVTFVKGNNEVLLVDYRRIDAIQR